MSHTISDGVYVRREQRRSTVQVPGRNPELVKKFLSQEPFSASGFDIHGQAFDYPRALCVAFTYSQQFDQLGYTLVEVHMPSRPAKPSERIAQRVAEMQELAHRRGQYPSALCLKVDALIELLDQKP